MNTEAIEKVVVDGLTHEQKEDIAKLAACGQTPDLIATAIELPPDQSALFIALASVKGSTVNRMIAEGRANGIAAPQIKLQEAATAGNIDAIKELQRLQSENRFKELMKNMDDDEFTG